MSYVGQIIDIFVSSPGDVSSYRDSIISVVQSWNQRNGRTRGLFFNCLRWEDLVASDIGESGQDVINTQIGSEYDIFLGVMWARFGTPTANAESGTEEEFDRAMLRHQSGDSLKVSFLFCTADVPMTKLDGEQLLKVQHFKKKVQENGCLTRDFVDEASLINSVNLILDRFANTWKETSVSREVSETERAAPRQIVEVPSGRGDVIAPAQDEEPGLFDVLEDNERTNEEFARILNDWGQRLNAVSEKLNSTTEGLEEISKFGSPNADQVRTVLNRLTVHLEEFGIWCEEKVTSLEDVMSHMSRNILLVVDLSNDLNEPHQDIINARDSFETLVNSIDSARDGIASFVNSMESSPKLDKKLNKAIRRVIITHNRMIEKYALFKDDVLLCIDELDQRSV
jgi:hypothetical protein